MNEQLSAATTADEGELDEGVSATPRTAVGAEAAPHTDHPAAVRIAVDLVHCAGFAAMLLVGPDLIVTAYNDGYAQFLRGRPDAMGQPMLDVWAEVREQIEPDLRRVWAGETVQHQNVRFELLRHDGLEECWFDYSYTPIRDEHGAVVGILNAAVERTAQVRAEAALRASEAEARADAERVQLALQAGAIIGTWYWDLTTDRITVDKSFAEAFGIDPAYGREGLSVAQVVETVHPDDQACLAATMNEAIVRGGPYAHQYRVRRRDGKYYWIEANGEVRHAPDGTPLNFPGVLLDIEERRQTEKARREDEARLSAVLEAMPVGVVIVDGAGKLLRQNAAHAELWDTHMATDSWEDFARWPTYDADSGEPVPLRQSALTRALLDGETTVGELVRIMPVGGAEARFVMNNAAPIRGADSAIIGAVLANQDVTALREVESALAEAVAQKEVLLYEVNHRVKNNLQVITSLLGMQAKQSADADVKRHLLAARARIDVIASIHQKLYTTGAHSTVEIVSFLHELGRGMLGSLGDGRVSLQLPDAAPVHLPLATALPLSLMVGELLTNALKYAFPDDRGGTVVVAVNDRERTFEVTVSDDGVGLPELFDLARPSSVGMRVVTALAKQIRAKIVSLPAPRGTAFSISVPKE